MTISFAIETRERPALDAIVDRATVMAKANGVRYSRMECEMDICACHLNGTRLQLTALVEADDFNFAHDIFGIRRHISRETGKLENCFLPRFAEPQRTRSKSKPLPENTVY